MTIQYSVLGFEPTIFGTRVLDQGSRPIICFLGSIYSILALPTQNSQSYNSLIMN